MKYTKIKFLIITLFVLYSILFTSCLHENPLTEVSVFSGSWKIVMSYNNSSTYYRQASVLIKDDGSFCNKIFIYPGNLYLFIQGSVNENGDFSAQFGDSCGVNLSGSVTGNLTETSGITIGKGDWNDTLRNSSAKGTWISRRN